MLATHPGKKHATETTQHFHSYTIRGVNLAWNMRCRGFGFENFVVGPKSSTDDSTW